MSAAFWDSFQREVCGFKMKESKLAGWRSAAASGELSSSEVGPYFCKCWALRHIFGRLFSESEFRLGSRNMTSRSMMYVLLPGV